MQTVFFVLNFILDHGLTVARDIAGRVAPTRLHPLFIYYFFWYYYCAPFRLLSKIARRVSFLSVGVAATENAWSLIRRPVRGRKRDHRFWRRTVTNEWECWRAM